MFALLEFLFPKTFDFYGRRPNILLTILPPAGLTLAVYKLATDLPDLHDAPHGMSLRSFIFWTFVLTLQIWAVFLSSIAFYRGPREEGHIIRVPNLGFAAGFYARMWYSDFAQRSHKIAVIVKAIGIGMALFYGFFVASSAWRVWTGQEHRDDDVTRHGEWAGIGEEDE